MTYSEFFEFADETKLLAAFPVTGTRGAFFGVTEAMVAYEIAGGDSFVSGCMTDVFVADTRRFENATDAVFDAMERAGWVRS